MPELIHVHIGTIDGNFPVRKHITSGPMAGMIELQQSKDTIAWVHQRWCSELGATQAITTYQPTPTTQDTDWRKFLHDHWLQDRNMLNPDYAEEFMHVFMAAQQAWKAKQTLASDASTPASSCAEPSSAPEPQHPSCAQPFRAEEKKEKLYPDEVIKTKHNTWIQLSLF